MGTYNLDAFEYVKEQIGACGISCGSCQIHGPPASCLPRVSELALLRMG